MTFWDSATFHEYEHLCGDEPGTRARLLASANWSTRIVDLSLSEAELWQGVRKSYRSLIHKAEREYMIDIDLDGAVPAARHIHAEVSGRETRPAKTWLMMESWVWSDAALIVLARQDQSRTIEGVRVIQSEMVGYVYVVMFRSWAYYHSAASLKDNLTHALIWHAMKALKARSVRYFEIGWMDRPGDDEKARGICQFKRGFGGYDILAKEAPKLCGP